MKLFLDKTELELVLERKRDWIGNRVSSDAIIAAVSFLLSVASATYDNPLGIPALIPKTVFCMLGVWYAVKTAHDFIQYCRNKYNHLSLLKDIEELNEIQYEHSIICIRDTFNAVPTRFLLYYDERWDCKLFLNTNTVDKGNEAAILDQISSWLRLDKNSLYCRYLTSHVHEKYSVSHKENRVYSHRIYEVQIFAFPEMLRGDDFTIEDRHYYWMSMEDMENERNIQKKNMDVVNFVKDCFE